jgi:D-inositol-3-phosphate glycosyltransferase
VEHGRTGFLVEGGDPAYFGAYVDELLGSPMLAAELGRAAAERGRTFTWSTTAARLRRLYADLATRALVTC